MLTDSLENTDHANSFHTQQILQREAKTWQETLYKFYFRTNRLYKQINCYAWRFAELHVFKFVLLIMVLTSTLKVNNKFFVFLNNNNIHVLLGMWI